MKRSFAGLVFQVPKEESSTGFIKVVAVDESEAHPAANVHPFDYIICVFDPRTGSYGEHKRITRDELETIMNRNGK